jgi:hypothetical protein
MLVTYSHGRRWGFSLLLRGPAFLYWPPKNGTGMNVIRGFHLAVQNEAIFKILLAYSDSADVRNPSASIV